MVDKIEMSLDDIIKSNRSQKVGQGRRGAGGARRGGPQRGGRRGGASGGVSPRKTPGGGFSGGSSGVLKGRNRGGIQQKAKFARGDVNSAWKHDMYDGPRRGGIAPALATNTGQVKLAVSNLDYGVSDGDIMELFAEFGPLKKAYVHYDYSGRSLGTAEVIFERRSDALKAVKQYNGVPLDGRPMTIHVNTDSALVRGSRLGAPNQIKRRTGGASPVKRGGPPPQNTGGRRGGVKRGGGKPGGGAGGARRERPSSKTAEELDAELDAYVNDMKI